MDLGLSFGRQFIDYDDNEEYSNKDTPGPGIYFSYSKILRPIISYHLGFSAAYEFHDYERFHYYHETKITTFFRYTMYPNCDPESDYYFYGDLGLGLDFVYRDDEDFATYFLLHGGIGVFIKSSRNTGVFASLDGQLTFQDGSKVYHTNGVLGFRYKYGGQKSK